MSTSPFPALLALPPLFHNTEPRPDFVTQGAEGHLLKTVFLDASKPAALKIRPSKPYRHRVLDQRLTRQRVLAEARVLMKLGNLGLGVPTIFAVDWRVEGRETWDKGDGPSAATAAVESDNDGEGAWLLMEWVEGSSVRRLLQRIDMMGKGGLGARAFENERSIRQLLRRVGWAVGKMHSVGGVVHGDLTSSNVMVRSRVQREPAVNGLLHDEDANINLEGEVVLIDFGLASQSVQDEDRAVDLYVLERAFGSTHPKQEAMFVEEVLHSQEGYKGSFRGSKVVLNKLEEVRLRGRKRSMIG